MGDSGLGSNVVLTGVSYRQLDYWARTGLVGSSIRQAKGHGSRRVYSFQDLVALRVVARLLDAVVIAIDVEPIVKDLRADVTELSAAREIDVRARGHGYRAVLTPDLEAGGYTVEVPELPGCITEGTRFPKRGGWRARPSKRGSMPPRPSTLAETFGDLADCEQRRLRSPVQ